MKKVSGKQIIGIFIICILAVCLLGFFLELVYDHPDDGGARYYLYLADRMEKQADQEISLDY